MNNSGAAIQGVSPSDSGPPMAKPMNPAARRRNSGASGEPDHRWRRPRTDSAIKRRAQDQPGPRVGIGLGPHQHHRHGGDDDRQRQDTRADERPQHACRPTRRPAGRRRTTSSRRRRRQGPAEPARSRRGDARARCRGPARSTAPRRRCPCAAISQVARMARPQVSPAATSSDRLRRLAGLLALLRDAAGRALRDPPAREVAFDLLVRVPERAAVLLAMTASLVANTSSAPPATLVTAAQREMSRTEL